MEDNMEKEVDIDMDELHEDMYTEVKNDSAEGNNSTTHDSRVVNKSSGKADGLINCLRNERITIKHVPKAYAGITNPKHLLYGGMSESSTRTYSVPKLSSGLYVNVLTDSEKEFLEDAMGLEYNALSIYKKEDNFWSSSSKLGVSQVKLSKSDNYLYLNNPADYIRYKILLANKDYIAPSLQVLQDKPKATYEFVILRDDQIMDEAESKMDNTMRCYKEFGKVEDDIDTLRVIVELIERKPTASTSKLPFLKGKIQELISADSKLFLRVITDDLLPAKVLIRKATEKGIISNRGGFYYLRDGNLPLCSDNEDPTLSSAAKFLSAPKNQDVKFTIEAKLKQ